MSSADPNFSQNDTKTYNVKTQTIAAIIVAVVLCLLIAAVVLVYKYFDKHRLRSINSYTSTPTTPPHTFVTIPSEKIRTRTVESFLNELAGEKPIRFSPQQVADCTQNYTTKLGSGGFGSVYKGELPNGVLVAVKVLTGNLDKRAEEQFMAEVGTTGRTYHINLVRLYGFCFDATVRAQVYEYMENGSLDKYLFDKDRCMDLGMLHQIAVGTAKGIRYLHEECQQRIIHYDIKPGNILLDSNFNPKVADFGLAKLMSREYSHMSMTGMRGTPGYAAPEMWMLSPVTNKCDVYSFGMLLFEIVGRRRNFDVSETDSQQQWFPRLVYEKFKSGLLPEIVSSCGIEKENKEKAERMCKVALWCVQYNPEARPPMSKVVKMLEGEMEITPPMNPFQYLDTLGAVMDLWDGSGTDSTSTRGSGTTPLRGSTGTP